MNIKNKRIFSMGALAGFLKSLFFRRKSVPAEVLGSILVSLSKTSGAKVKAEFKGHTDTLSLPHPTCVFDLFKHGLLLIYIGGKCIRVPTKELNLEQVIESKGVSITVRYTPSKKKLTVDDFLILRVLGRGSFGKVVLAKHRKTERLYACKIIKKTQFKGVDKITNEKNILAQISFPFLIHLLAAFQTQDRVYLILPYIEGGELFHHLHKENTFPEEIVRVYVAEIITAVDHLHRNGIIYRDIKPENILLDREGHIVLCDFGLSIKNVCATTYCGTPEYIAPEIIREDKYTEAVDYYTIGVLLYEMLCGSPPFTLAEGEDKEDLESKILFSEAAYPEPLSEAARSLISALLRKTPASRPRVAEIKAHPFFREIDWGRVERKEYTPKYVPAAEEEKEETVSDSLGHQNDTYNGSIPGFTYYTEEWE